MDRNLLLAIVLSVLIILGFQLYFQSVTKDKVRKPGKPVITEKTLRKAKPSPEQQPGKKTATTGSGQETKAPIEPTRESLKQFEQTKTGPVPETFVTINCPKYEATLSSQGARIISFKLKDYKKTLEGDELIDLFRSKRPDTAGPSIMLTWEERTFDDRNLAYESDSKEKVIDLSGESARKSISFRAKTKDGLALVKTYTFHPGNYTVGVSYTLTNETGQKRNYLVTFPWKKFYPKETDKNRYSWNSAEFLLNNEIKDIYFSKIEEDRDYSGEIKWAGLGSTYFLKCMVPEGWQARKMTLFKPTKEGVAELWLRAGSLDLSSGSSASRNLLLYLGPKEHTALIKAGHELSRSLFYSRYWVFDLMAQYLMNFLRYSHYGFNVFGLRIPGTGNWGWDIIILTIIIKVLFIPLTHKQTKSMKRMQDLQPKIAEMKAKYKDDKQAQNKAMMDLFKEHNVNPIGGCWPMFLQLPVFIALYQALLYAIELRHAYFVCIPSIYLCLKDLSAPDPYYITPILMGGSMVLQQWLTPATGDPTQRKMMMIMPVVFTYIFLSFPSGLVVYWLVSNLLSIGQQLLTNTLTK